MKKLMVLLAIVIAVSFTACPDTDKSTDDITYKITFDANGGTGGPASVNAAFDKELPKPAGSVPVKAGFFFSGYYDKEGGPDDGGVMYYTSNLTPAKKWDKQEDTILYAYWTEKQTAQIIFNSNGGSGDMTPQSVYQNDPVALTANAFTKTGYSFAGWAATETGAVAYAGGATITVAEATVTLYAVWTARTFTISFDANTGTGGQTATVTATYDAPMPALSGTAPTKDGSDFDGYYDTKTGGTHYYYSNLTSARNWDKTEDTTLYAVWSVPTVTAENSSIVSLVQSPSTITQASQYTYATIKELVDEAISLAGGLQGIVKFGDTVVLKPNIICSIYGWATTGTVITRATNATTAAEPNGACTDWRVVQAVAENVRAIVGPKDGAGSGKILVLESSGKGKHNTTPSGTQIHYTNLNYTLTNLTAVDEIRTLDNVGGSFWTTTADFTAATPKSDEILKVKLPNHVFTNAWSFTGGGSTVQSYDGQGNYHVVKEIYNADVLINIPVLKLHQYASGTTGGIKNISIGATPPMLFGRQQTGTEANDIGRNDRIPHSTANGLEKWIADYYAAMPADFTVMEALQAIHNGPIVETAANFNSYKKNMRAMLASKDGLAVDVVETLLLKLDPEKVGHLVYLTQRGEVGIADRRINKVRGNAKDITVVGNVKVGDIRDSLSFTGSVAGLVHTNNNGTITTGSAIGSTRLSATELAKPTISINSALFTGQELLLRLNVSEATVKVDIYIDNKYIRSVNEDLDTVLIDASTIAAGSRSIKVEAYTRFMAYQSATITATK